MRSQQQLKHGSAVCCCFQMLHGSISIFNSSCVNNQHNGTTSPLHQPNQLNRQPTHGMILCSRVRALAVFLQLCARLYQLG